MNGLLHIRRMRVLTLACAMFGVLGACSPNLSEIRPNNADMRNFHPYPQVQIGRSIQIPSLDGTTTYVYVAPSIYEKSEPFLDPPGTNLIDNVNYNMFDSFGREIPNTLPSTPEKPYNLHADEVQVIPIDARSPTTDLRKLLRGIKAAAEAGTVDQAGIQEALDILEGNPVFPDRTYNGFPVLHYNGPDKQQSVEPIYDADGNVVGGNVNIHQLWYDSRIEGDTNMLDINAVFDVPWTITYTVDVLDHGADDFAPFAIFVDDPYFSTPGKRPESTVGMDQTFYPMLQGNRYIIKILMPPGKYYDVIYYWGWRVHPPRIQAVENANKVLNGRTLPEYISRVFGDNPTGSREAQLAAIAMLGDLAPAKQMWNALRSAQDGASPAEVLALMDDAETSFIDWQDRTKLPHDIEPDPDADVTLFYANNTIYGEMKGGGRIRFNEWQTRPQKFKVALINGDYYVHGYQNVDFGGNRGWENQFQPTVTLGGSGAGFTFGRAHWWINAGRDWGLIDVPPAEGDVPGRHWVELNFESDPGRRLRMYQFDPYHHDVAIFSIH